MKDDAKKFLLIGGATGATMLFLALFVFVAERLGLMDVRVVVSISDWPPLDIWLIVILCVFTPPIYIMYYLIYKFKILEV